MKFRATEVVLALAIRADGAAIQRVVGEACWPVPDRLGRMMAGLAAGLVAAALTADDFVGSAMELVDHIRVSVFIIKTGVVLCLKEIAV